MSKSFTGQPHSRQIYRCHDEAMDTKHVPSGCMPRVPLRVTTAVPLQVDRHHRMGVHDVQNVY